MMMMMMMMVVVVMVVMMMLQMVEYHAVLRTICDARRWFGSDGGQ